MFGGNLPHCPVIGAGALSSGGDVERGLQYNVTGTVGAAGVACRCAKHCNAWRAHGGGEV